MNNENLKPVRNKSEARERGRKGGVASGISRNKKKTMRESLRTAWDTPITNSKIEGKLERAGFPPTNGGLIMYNMMARAGKNANFAKLILELLGEIGSDGVTINNTNTQENPVKVYLPDNKRDD